MLDKIKLLDYGVNILKLEFAGNASTEVNKVPAEDDGRIVPTWGASNPVDQQPRVFLCWNDILQP